MARFHSLLALILATAFASYLRADLPRNTITIPAAKEGGAEKCVRALAPHATCAAVSDAASTLVIAVNPPGADGALLAFALDAHGAIAQAAPVRVALAKPASLAAFKLIATAIYSHPRLPLVYVWQDVMPADGTTIAAPADVVLREFDHLLVYKIAGNVLTQIKATARGPSFAHGIPSATLASDATTTAATDDRLYLPNLQRANPGNTEKPYMPIFGFVALDESGMPAETSGALAINHCVDLVNPIQSWPTGIVPFSKRVTFVGNFMQLASLDLGGEGSSVSLYCDGSQVIFATGDRTLARVYGAGLNSPYLYNVEQIGGMFTMLPQRATVTGLSVQSQPVIDMKSHQLVVGGETGVHLIAIDDQGLFAGTQHQLIVGHAVRAVSYSPKFDRIYVPVEKLP